MQQQKRLTNHKDSSTTTPAEIQGQKHQRQKCLQKEKRAHRSKWWSQHPSQTLVCIQ